MERATHDDCWDNWLAYRAGLAKAIIGLLPPGFQTSDSHPVAENLADSPEYACAMARVKYQRSAMPMPDANDVQGMWRLYKTVYNTASGAATESEFMNAWDHWVASNPIS
jgi:hypothetical protein